MEDIRKLSLLVKPASYRCNLRCSYCFYLGKERLFGSGKVMTGAILERMISSFLALDLPVHAFGWQGGEPTLMGLDFFRQVTDLQSKYGSSGRVVCNGLQTNGVLLDDDWCRHLAKFNFLVGISIDGPAGIHNRHRITTGGDGSYALVMRGLEALKRGGVEHNILTLVSDSNAGRPLDVYNHLKELGAKYHQYIECVEFDGAGNLMPYAVKPGQWGEFLCRIFDEWYAVDRFKVSVRLFDSILAMMLDGQANVCAMAKNCCQYLVVEHNGDVYPCDFFVEPEHKLGNIETGGWLEFVRSPAFAAFGAAKSCWNARCASCRYLEFCAGCCRKNRAGRGAVPGGLSALCEGWELFYQHALPRLREIAGQLRRERELAAMRDQRVAVKRGTQTESGGKPGRNDPCICGSGEKFKKCCGR